MINIQTKDRRRVEVSKKEDGDYELKIMLNRFLFPDRYIATLVVSPDEFNKLEAFFSEGS